MPSARPILVFLLALAWLAWGVGQTGLALREIDRVSHIRAQDEAVYSHISLEMARTGDWITPRFLHRLALFKPPLLYWLTAASVQTLGENLLALRLPNLIAGALVPALLVHWIGGARGLLAALLLLLHPLWHTLARMALTDMLLALWITLAAAAIHRQRPRWFVLPVTAAILTKAIAGVIPMAVAGLWWLLSPKKDKARLVPWILASLAAIALSLPWFLAQYWLYPHWFHAEFVRFELLGFSFGAPPQTSNESQALFYLSRLLRTQPLLLILGLWGAAGAWLQRKNGGAAILLLAWLAMMAAAVFANQYRNIAYVLPALPALAWLAAAYTPLKRGFWPVLASLLCLGMGAWQLAHPENPAGLDPRPGWLPAAGVLERYAALQRPRELILIEPEDQFVATTLPLRRLRYAYLAPESAFRRYGLDFRALGLVLTPEEFTRRDEWPRRYTAALRAMDIADDRVLGTLIAAPDAAALHALVQSHPQTDFLLPPRWRHLASSAHEPRETEAGLLLLAVQ